MVALLGDLPDPYQEPLLVQLGASVWRLINQAYHAIRGGQINEFDQVQINTFFRQLSIWNQPIQIRLQAKTYHWYTQVWQRLVCFAYRSSRPDQVIQLRHQLNTTQLAALDQIEEYARRLAALATNAIAGPATPVVHSDPPPPPPPLPPPPPMASARAPRTVPWKRKEALATPAGTLPRLAPRVPQIPGPVEPQAPSLPCPGEAPDAPWSP
jgi:hypothetical protein